MAHFCVDWWNGLDSNSGAFDPNVKNWSAAKKTTRAAAALMNGNGGDTLWIRPAPYKETNATPIAPAVNGVTGNHHKFIADIDGSMNSGSSGLAVIDMSDATGWHPTASSSVIGGSTTDFLDLKGLWLTGADIGYNPGDNGGGAGTYRASHIEDCIFEGASCGCFMYGIQSQANDGMLFDRTMFIRHNVTEAVRLTGAVFCGIPCGASAAPIPTAEFRECMFIAPGHAIRVENYYTQAWLTWWKFVDCSAFSPLDVPVIYTNVAGPSINVKLTLQRTALFGQKDRIDIGAAPTMELLDYNAIHRSGVQACLSVQTYLDRRGHLPVNMLVPSSPLIGAVGAAVDTDPRPARDIFGEAKRYDVAQDLGCQKWTGGPLVVSGGGGGTVVRVERPRFWKP